MGASFGSNNPGKQKVDVEINVVPFIDLMSCLTAFLLVTAVWSNHAQIKNEPAKVGGKPGSEVLDLAPSVLVTESGVFFAFGDSDPQPQFFAKRNGAYDWTALGGYLESNLDVLEPSVRVEIAADDRVTYQYVVDAMDTVTASGYSRISYIDAASMRVQFRL